MTREVDGSIVASGASPATDTYRVTATTALKHVTAVRLEVLPDERFAAGGPGRGANGNFILSEFRLSATPRALAKPPATAPSTKPATIDVAFSAARADL